MATRVAKADGIVWCEAPACDDPAAVASIGASRSNVRFYCLRHYVPGNDQ